jgi:hypothetical protein
MKWEGQIRNGDKILTGVYKDEFYEALPVNWRII